MSNQPEYPTTGNAVISTDGFYRYCLIRRWSPEVEPNDSILWVMLNPSTADATEDDNTIRKITKFSKRWGYSSLIVVNLFAWRSRHPESMVGNPRDVIGPDNEQWIDNWMTVCDDTIAAWGQSFPKPLAPYVSKQAQRLHDKGAKHMGLTKDGHPKHPLFLKDITERQPWM